MKDIDGREIELGDIVIKTKGGASMVCTNEEYVIVGMDRDGIYLSGDNMNGGWIPDEHHYRFAKQHMFDYVKEKGWNCWYVGNHHFRVVGHYYDSECSKCVYDCKQDKKCNFYEEAGK